MSTVMYTNQSYSNGYEKEFESYFIVEKGEIFKSRFLDNGEQIVKKF